MSKINGMFWKCFIFAKEPWQSNLFESSVQETAGIKVLLNYKRFSILSVQIGMGTWGFSVYLENFWVSEEVP